MSTNVETLNSVRQLAYEETGIDQEMGGLLAALSEIDESPTSPVLKNIPATQTPVATFNRNSLGFESLGSQEDRKKLFASKVGTCDIPLRVRGSGITTTHPYLAKKNPTKTEEPKAVDLPAETIPGNPSDQRDVDQKVFSARRRLIQIATSTDLSWAAYALAEGEAAVDILRVTNPKDPRIPALLSDMGLLKYRQARATDDQEAKLKAIKLFGEAYRLSGDVRFLANLDRVAGTNYSGTQQPEQPVEDESLVARARNAFESSFAWVKSKAMPEAVAAAE